MRKLIFSLVALALVAGCASQDTKEQAGAAVEDRKPGVGDIKPPVAAKPVTVAPVAKPIVSKPIVANPLKDPNNILSKRSVYYDYDSTIIKDEFKPLVTAHARYLAQNRSTKMVIQGNTDERGSREYNIALGQRRADGVKQMMLLLGAQHAQIETVSFGEEKPRAAGKDEASFSQNRRSDIVYQGE
ncbi:MAG: peptidoglycan-associated lipoprotein [Betaproteobacteria bacterium RIFCSPLOWO2_12_FULL_62_13]|nr:MAG: peptidoglycan-associated lipoprotein [Betaproteobacteria bacterium RIFCSPLOWO2_12_FULL_62_13]